jgi:hypothetical protein
MMSSDTKGARTLGAKEARDLGASIGGRIEAREPRAAYEMLAPVLARRTPFVTLGRIGAVIGTGSVSGVRAFLDEVASHQAEGGWVIIGTALGQQLDRDREGALALCRAYAVKADVWYGADILGERVPGPALVADFDPALALMVPWREDADRWVRRMAGVSVHFWAKRSSGAVELRPQASDLLRFLEPMFGEWQMDAVKGVGWGLKTLGKQYPDLVTDWLVERVIPTQPKYRALMLRKALTWLSDEQKQRVLSAR